MFFSIFVLFSCLGWSRQADWNYTAPWGGICRSGQKQSPIDLRNTATTNYGPIKFNDAAFQPVGDDLKMINNGHSIKLYGPAIERVEVSGGGLRAKYGAVQLHFHWGSHNGEGSEHTLKGKAYPLEMHLVTTRFKSLKDALDSEEPDALAVLGVFYDKQEKKKRCTKKSLENFIMAVRNPNVERRPKGLKLKVADLFPRDLGTFYRYEGSLTTPPCTEVVRWTVFEKTKMIKSSELEAFRKVLTTDNAEIRHNFRGIQNLNGRRVYLNNSPSKSKSRD